jgi:hypothetical protein
MHDHEGRDPTVVLVLRGLADIATTAAKAAGLDFSMIGPPCLVARQSGCGGDSHLDCRAAMSAGAAPNLPQQVQPLM